MDNKVDLEENKRVVSTRSPVRLPYRTRTVLYNNRNWCQTQKSAEQAAFSPSPLSLPLVLWPFLPEPPQQQRAPFVWTQEHGIRA